MRLMKSGHVPRAFVLARKEPKVERNVVEDLSPIVGEIAHGNLPVGPQEAEVLDKVLGKVWKDSGG